MAILAWFAVGTAAGLFMRLLMPIPKDGGNLLAIGVGVACACLGGGLAVAWLGGGVTGMNWYSVAWATIGALYSLFIFRCLTMRPR